MKKIRHTAEDAIVEAAFELLSQNSQTPLGDIAERAGVGRATLHRYFAGRDDLVRRLARQAIDEMDAAVEGAVADAASHGEALRRSLEVLIPLGDRHGFLALEPMDGDADMAGAFDRMTRETAEAVKAAQDEGVFDKAVPVAWIVQAYDHLLYAGWEAVKEGDLTASQAAAFAWRTLTSGLGE